jgi:hypothetical protein
VRRAHHDCPVVEIVTALTFVGRALVGDDLLRRRPAVHGQLIVPDGSER